MVKKLSIKAFKGYNSHYREDKRSDSSKCDEVYANWAYQTCLSRDANKEVLVFLNEDTFMGFVILEINDDGLGEIPLTGIDPIFQGTGIYATVANAQWAWFKE